MIGEYANDQMLIDYKRMAGGAAERVDYESERRTLKKPVCPTCGKLFGAHIAVRDHMRDKNAAPDVGAA